jgi:manganese/iron transport system permease protein
VSGAEDFGQPLIELLIGGLMVLVNLMPEGIREPFQYGFMQRALLTSVLVGGVCGLLSSYVILKRWSLLGDAISHAVLPGVAIAYLLGWPFFVGAFITGALTSLGIGVIERHSRIKSDAAMGLMFTAAFALGVVIISQITTSTHLMHILFGNVLGVRQPALLLTLFSGVMVLLVVVFFYKPLLVYVFDPVQARSLGMNTSLMHYGLMLLLTLTIVASLETVGIILVVSMLITPGATAYLLVNRLPSMMLLSTLIGIASSVIGLYLAFRFNVASGGAMVLVVTAMFLLAFLFAPHRGVISYTLRRRRARAV